MHRLGRLVAATAVLFLLLPFMARADLLGVAPGFPMTVFNSTGATVYNAGTRMLTVKARPIATRFSAGAPPIIHDRTTVGAIRIAIEIDSDGVLVVGGSGDSFRMTGAIDIDGGAPPELTGVLLTGQVLGFGYHDSGGPTDTLDFRFQVTGGALASHYAGADIGVRVTMERSDFAGDFNLDFVAGAKGIAGPVDAAPACGLTVSKTASPDFFTAIAPPSCDTEGKPFSLTFRYTGGGCAASDNDQKPRKTDCSGAIDNILPVTVTAGGGRRGNRPYDVLPTTVGPGDDFTITPATKFKSSSVVTLDDGSSTETIEFHTSCSQPLKVGDVFGSLTLIAINGVAVTGTPVAYHYEIRNDGSDLSNVQVVDDRLGVLASGVELEFGDDPLILDATEEIFDTTTNIVVVTGETTAGGQICQASASATVTAEPPPASCADGKPTKLVFEYTGESCDATTNDQDGKLKCRGDFLGTEPVQIAVAKRNKKILVTPPDIGVAIGDMVTIESNRGKKLPSTLRIKIRRLYGSKMETVQKLRIHASCSKPLEVGDQFGSLILRQFVPWVK